MFSKWPFTITALFLATAVIYFIFFVIEQQLNWKDVWAYRELFFQGWIITLGLSLASLLLSLCIGIVIAMSSRSQWTFLNTLARIYVEIIRGTPLLVQILFFYYVVAHSIGLDNRYIAGITILSMFNGAYLAEIIRGGIETVSATQLDSSRAIGLSTLQSYRFVIFPQAIRHILPPLTGQFASIIKDSSLLSIIGINELTNSAQQINSATYSTLEIYFPLGLAYLLLTLPISLFSKRLEKRFQYET